MPRPYKFSFSYSRWSMWKKCPYGFKLTHVDKITFEPSKAMLDGREVHDDIAKYLEKKTDDMPERLAKNFSMLGEQMREFAGAKVLVEEQMAFDEGKGRVSWFGANAKYRFIWDVGLVYQDGEYNTDVIAVDWKTGKPYGSYDDQAQMFCLPALWMYEKVDSITGKWIYLDTGDIVDYHFDAEQLKVIERTWLANAAMMEADTSYAPTPSEDSCKWCDHNPARGKGGTCKWAFGL